MVTLKMVTRPATSCNSKTKSICYQSVRLSLMVIIGNLFAKSDKTAKVANLLQFKESERYDFCVFLIQNTSINS